MARNSPRPALPWLSPVVDAGVLLAGVLHLVLSGATPGLRFAVFAAALAVLIAVDVALASAGSRADPGPVCPAVPAVLLVVHVLLFALIVAVDDAGAARVLFLLVPFHAWTAFGALPGAVLGLATLVGLPTWLVLAAPAGGSGASAAGSAADLVMFALGLVLTCALAALVVRERRLRERLDDAGAAIAALSAAAERRRVAREVHDSVGHHLTATAVQLDKAIAFRTLDPSAADAAVTHARQSVTDALQEVRTAVGGLREREVATRAGDLVALLRGAGSALGGDDLTVGVCLVGADEPLDGRLVEAAHAVAREALTNVRRHARARQAEVVVQVEGNRLGVRVTDDGRGLPAEAVPGQGLRGMRERVEELGGELTVRGGVSGTAVTAWLPLGGPGGVPSGAKVPT